MAEQLDPIQYDDLRYAAFANKGVMFVYSGRGMFGDTCLGIQTTVPAAAFTLRLMHELWAHYSDSNLADLLATSPMFIDDMGKGSVIYWPGIAAEGETE